jgi:hypothetical protein
LELKFFKNWNWDQNGTETFSELEPELELKLVENWTFLVLFMCELEPKQTFERKRIFEKRKKGKTRTKG